MDGNSRFVVHPVKERLTARECGKSCWGFKEVCNEPTLMVRVVVLCFFAVQVLDTQFRACGCQALLVSVWIDNFGQLRGRE